MKYDRIDEQLFIDNRKRLAAKMAPNSMAILQSNDFMPRSADGFHEWRQSPDFLYFSGIDQEESVLVIFPDCVKEDFREVLFIKKTNEHIKVWEGHKYTQEEATQTSGITKVIWLDNMSTILNELINLSDHVYLNTNEHDRYSSPVMTREDRYLAAFKQDYPAHSIKRLAPIMKDLRSIKHDIEIALMQHACNITKAGFDRVLNVTRPGIWEYEIEAAITHEFLCRRATGHAYHPIIATGDNANILHYNENNTQCKAGELILMDFGCEYANYASDLSRTIPVSGTFTDRQRDVYNACLNVQNAAIDMLRPGTNLDAYHKEVGKVMESELINVGLLDRTEVSKQDPARPLYKKYFMHGTSHHIGIDVHDVASRYATFEAGMVLTCEPGIYIPEEGFGIRIEDDIVITDGAPRNLMADIPKTVEAIQDHMNAA